MDNEPQGRAMTQEEIEGLLSDVRKASRKPEDVVRENSVYEKLTIARSELAKLQIKKTGTGQYNYLELSDFLPHVHGIFEVVGLCGCLEFSTEQARLIIVDTENPDSKIVFTSPVTAANLIRGEPIKVLGATQTYIRRYLWLQALEISVPDEVDKQPKAVYGISSPIPFKKPLDDLPDDLPQPTIEERLKIIKETNTVVALNAYYRGLPLEARGNQAIVDACKTRKEELSGETE